MSARPLNRNLRLPAEWTMLLVLFCLGVVFSVLTWKEQRPEGAGAGAEVARRVIDHSQRSRNVIQGGIIIVAMQSTALDREFLQGLTQHLKDRPDISLELAAGELYEIRQTLTQLHTRGVVPIAIVATPTLRGGPLVQNIPRDFPDFQNPPILTAEPYVWPTFLKRDNLVNITNEITVYAIVAIGMTVVIILGGIDLSVGSLIALSAMICCFIIERGMKGIETSPWGMVTAGLAAIAVCGAVGLMTGLFVTKFRIPPFVVTLAVMLSASGLAGWLTKGAALSHIPPSMTTFASGKILGIPHAVWIMLFLFLIAHIVMSRTRLGRHIYAAGGNLRAAKLSGIPTDRLLLFAYSLAGMMAGLAGVIMASRLKSASPTYGQTYELYVIAAVVVGGTSLSGGSGSILGTLIGALIIAVIQNGMNLVGIEAFTQKIVMGGVLLTAVVVDQLKRPRSTS